ncbi:ER lumen protein-retaining receptor [Tanacetum coccineum]
MNIFRLAGDMTHLASVLVLLLKIHTIKSCAGLGVCLAFMIGDFGRDYNSRAGDRGVTEDSGALRTGFCYSLLGYLHRLHFALLIHEKFTVKEVLWTFSIYLEAVAILPQLVLLQRTRNIDNLTGQYVFLLGAYRSLYILNWIYRYFTERHFVHWITWIAGLVQTLLYADFFYYYFESWKNNVKLQLPA